MVSYANQYEPDLVSAPGETLTEMLDELDMTQSELAERTGRPKQLISDIATGRKQITPETALQFEKALGVSASFWNNRETRYREGLEKAEEGLRLEAEVNWLKSFPVRKMINLGWLPDSRVKVEQLRALLAYFGMASPERWEHVWSKRELAFRKSEAFNVDRHSLSAWLRRGEIQARAIPTVPFSATAFGESLRRLRALTCEPDPAVFIPSLRDTCASAGVAVVFVPELPGCLASGVTQWLASDKALIQLSLRYKADDHLWFTFFHEAGHILKHGKRKIFVELGSASDTEMEREADRFSADWLIPRADLNREFLPICDSTEHDHTVEMADAGIQEVAERFKGSRHPLSEREINVWACTAEGCRRRYASEFGYFDYDGNGITANEPACPVHSDPMAISNRNPDGVWYRCPRPGCMHEEHRHAPPSGN